MSSLFCSGCKVGVSKWECGNRCGKAVYCSESCAKRHYNIHKIECVFHMNNHWETILQNKDPKRVLFKTDHMSAYAVSIEAGGGLPTEVHPDATQFFLVVSGQGSCTIAGNRDVIQAQSMFYVPPNTTHSIDAKNTLKLLTIYSPAEHHTH